MTRWALALAPALLAACAAEPPERVALDYLQAQYAGHYREAYTYLSVADRRAMAIGDYVGEQEQRADASRDAPAKARILGVRAVHVAADHAEVRIEVDAPPRQFQEVDLVWDWRDDNVSGDWHVDAMMQSLLALESPDDAGVTPRPDDPWWADDRPIEEIDPNAEIDAHDATLAENRIDALVTGPFDPDLPTLFEGAGELEALFPSDELLASLPPAAEDPGGPLTGRLSD